MSHVRFHRTAFIAAAAALTLAASAPSFAAGPFIDAELPSLRTPIESTATPLTREQVKEALRQARAAGALSTGGEIGDTDAVLAAREQLQLAAMAIPSEPTVAIAGVTVVDDQPLTRAEVKAELAQAREAGTLSKNGELADTDAVLAARERFNMAQADAIRTAYAEQQAYAAAFAAAEARLWAEIEAERVSMAPSADANNNISLEFLGGQSE